MTYPQNRRANPYSIYIIAIIVALILLVGDTIGILRFIRIPFEAVIVPPRILINKIKTQINNNIKIIFTPNLETKLIEADEKSQALDLLQSKVQLLEEENAALRSQLETPLPPAWDFIPALVLGNNSHLIIDKGEKDGVKEGMTVVYNNMLIGRVRIVNPRTSQVEFLTDPELKIPAKTNKNVRGLLTGAFGNKIMLTRILQKDSVNNFDIVLTSGEEGGMPPNLIIGKVSEVTSSTDEVYKEATIDPSLNYAELTHVFIISSF